MYHKYAYKQHAKPLNASTDDNKAADIQNNLNKTASTKSISQSLVNLGLPSFYRKIDKEILDKVVEFGYPRDMVIKSLKQNISNHCTTTYYLLCMDQTFI